jgi:hypothetical protein
LTPDLNRKRDLPVASVAFGVRFAAAKSSRGEFGLEIERPAGHGAYSLPVATGWLR